MEDDNDETIFYVYVYNYLTESSFRTRKEGLDVSLSTQFFKICEYLSANSGINKNVDEKQSIKKDGFSFHTLKMSPNQYSVCISTENPNLRVCYHLLEDIQEKWSDKITMKKGKRILKQLLTTHNNPLNNGIRVAEDTIKDIKTVMMKNLDKIFGTIEKLEIIEEKVETLVDHSVDFKKMSVRMNRCFLCNKRIMCFVCLCNCAIMFCIVFLVVTAAIIGFVFYIIITTNEDTIIMGVDFIKTFDEVISLLKSNY